MDVRHRNYARNSKSQELLGERGWKRPTLQNLTHKNMSSELSCFLKPKWYIHFVKRCHSIKTHKMFMAYTSPTPRGASVDFSKKTCSLPKKAAPRARLATCLPVLRQQSHKPICSKMQQRHGSQTAEMENVEGPPLTDGSLVRA